MTIPPIFAVAVALVLLSPLAVLAATPRNQISKAQAIHEMKTDGYTQIKDLRQTKQGGLGDRRRDDRPEGVAGASPRVALLGAAARCQFSADR